MSDSDSDGGPGLEGILWGNLGEGDTLELDYMPKDVVGALGAVTSKTGLGAALRREVDDVPGNPAAAAGGAPSGSGAAERGGVDYYDEETRAEDLEDDEFPVLRPAAAPAAAAAGASAAAAAAAAYGQRGVAGEDDYDDEAEEPAAAAGRPMPAQPLQAIYQQQQPAAAVLQQLPVAAGSALQQQYASLQQLHAAGMPLNSLQLQQQYQQHLAGVPGALPAVPEQPRQQPVFKRPQLTPEQERLRALNLATPAQDAQQEVLSFKYLDLDQLGEDIVHFSELYVPTDNQVKQAYLTSFARVPPSADRGQAQQDQPWERARQRADALLNRRYQQKALQAPGDDADVAEDETAKFHRGDVAVAAAEGNAVQLGLANMRLEVVEELSEPEEELYASDPQGLGRAMLQAARLNATRVAVKAVTKAAEAKAAATAGDADAAAQAAAEAADSAAASASLQGLTAGMQGLGLKGLAVNPHALDTLQADILPDWEQEVFWGAGTAAPPAGRLRGAPLTQSQSSHAVQLQLQLQPLSQGSMLPLAGSGQPSTALPGMSSALSALPGAGQVPGLLPSHTGLPGAFSAVPAGSMLSQGTGGPDALGQFAALGMQQLGPQDAAAMAAISMPDAAALAAVPAGGEGAGEQGKSGKGKRGKGPRMGKPRKPLDSALADLKLHRHMLRLMPSIAAAAAAQAAAEAADAAAAAAAAAAAGGDRAAAAALPHLWGGSAAGAPAAGASASAAAADAEEQLKLRHVGDLLQLDMKPVLPDEDDWLNDIVWDAQESAAAAAAAGAANNALLQQQQLAGSVSSLAAGFEGVGLGEQQQALVVRQQGGAGAGGRGGVLWDLNDPYMVFEAHSTQPFANASAMMHPVPAQAAPAVPPHLQNEKDVLLRQLAPLHISRDYLYQASERTSGRAMTTGRHSSLALNLTSVPTFPKDALTSFWHRPRSWWSSAHMLYSLEQMRRDNEVHWGRDPDAATASQYIFEPVGLNLRTGRRGNGTGDSPFSSIWEYFTGQKPYKDALAVEAPRMRSYGPLYDFMSEDPMRWMGAWLSREMDKNKTVAQLGFQRRLNYMIPVWSKVEPLKTKEVATLLPPNIACRPPAALKTFKSLSAQTQGHVLLLEYLEERPLMLLQTGMGMRLTTYYRRKTDSDMHYQALQAEYSEGLLARNALPLTSADRFEARPPWMVGTPQLLTPDDPSPFFELAPIPNGEMQFAVDTPCFRAPAVPHVANATDFLLVRLPGGNIALREFTGCVAVGQQHPSVAIWPPYSEKAVAYERARFKVWVIKTLRQRAERQAVKEGKAIPTVSIAEIQAPNTFGNYAFGPNANEIARLLQDECQCMPVPDKPGHWTFVPNAKLPSEQELKKLVTPDMAVQYEALVAGLGQRDQWHIGQFADQIHRQLADIGAGPVTTLRLVLDMLFPDTAGRQAATAIEQCVLNTPWAQSQAYQAALVQDTTRNPASLTLVGRGDPTGRGHGFSFIRDDPKKAKDEAAPPSGLQAQADGTITGTGADLRRLSNKRAGEILETKFGLDPAVVQTIARWDRIDLIRTNVRDPANAALVNSDPELQQWVRNVKMTAEDVRSKMRNTAAPLFAAQMNALHEPWDDGATSDDMSWGAPQQLAAAAAADTEAESAVSRAADAYNTVLASTTDPAALQAAQAAYEAQRKALPLGSGLFHGPPKPISLPPNHRNPPASSRGRGQEALVGQRRIRREITYLTANNSTVHRTVYIYSREEMAALNALYKSGENFGHRKVITTERKFQYERGIKLGEPFTEAWPTPQNELPPPPISEQDAAAAAAAAAAAVAGPQAAAAATAYWAAGADGAAAAAAAGGYAGYAPQQEAVAWQQPVAAAPTPPRAPKLTKKQKQQQALAAKKAAAAAAKKNKKRRRDDDFVSDDESFEISDSEDDAELALAAEGSDDNEGGGSPKAKRARPARAAAAAASGGGGGGGEGAAFVAPAAVGGMLPLVAPYVPPSDTAQGAADVYPAAEPLKLCLSELNFVLKPAVDAMIRFQASKSKMGGLKDTFLKAVPPQVLPDYAAVVPPERQMWLERIKQRLARQFYSSYAQFEADCRMIVEAARAYHTPGRGGRQPIPIVIQAASNTVTEGLKVLQTPEAQANIAYWEMRINMEKIRAQGPEAFKAFFQSALTSAQETYQKNEGQDVPGWHWVECDACKKWRLVTDYCYLMKQLNEETTTFRCSENLDWPAPSCDDAPHWVGTE